MQAMLLLLHVAFLHILWVASIFPAHAFEPNIKYLRAYL